MGAEKNHWCKIPNEFYRSAKYRRKLKPSAQLLFVWLRCMESEGFFADESNTTEDVAFALQLSDKAFERDLAQLRSAGLADERGCPIFAEPARTDAKTEAGRQDEKRFMDALKKYLSQFLVRDLSRNDEKLSRDKNVSDRDNNSSVTPRAREDQTRPDKTTLPPSPHGGPGVTDSSVYIYPMTDAEWAGVGRLVAGWPGIGGVATPGVRGAYCAVHRIFGIEAEDLLGQVEEQKRKGWFSGDRKMPRLERWLGDRYWTVQFTDGDGPDEKKNAALSAQAYPVVPSPDELWPGAKVANEISPADGPSGASQEEQK